MVSTLTLGPDFSVKYFAPTDHETNARPALAFVGDLDFSLAREVRDVLETLTPPVCIDLSQVRYLAQRLSGFNRKFDGSSKSSHWTAFLRFPTAHYGSPARLEIGHRLTSIINPAFAG
jgi:hypothetical protein